MRVQCLSINGNFLWIDFWKDWDWEYKIDRFWKWFKYVSSPSRFHVMETSSSLSIINRWLDFCKAMLAGRSLGQLKMYPLELLWESSCSPASCLAMWSLPLAGSPASLKLYKARLSPYPTYSWCLASEPLELGIKKIILIYTASHAHYNNKDELAWNPCLYTRNSHVLDVNAFLLWSFICLQSLNSNKLPTFSGP